ncbi:MAG TPA: EAL domain-containing protein [Thermoanaerobaculia bacterium]|nr:EAL domain-containing protein [Thermoanaerobaculia bacterium]
MMPADDPASLMLPGGRALVALLITVLLVRFTRSVEKRYATPWIRSWAALSIFHVAALVSILIASTQPAAHLYRLGLSVAGSAGGLFHAGLMLWGAAELANRRPFKLKSRKLILLALAGIGITVPLFLLVFPDEIRFQLMLPDALHALVTAAVLVASCYLIRHARPQQSSALLIFNLAFLAYATLQLAYGVTALIAISRNSAIPLATHFSVADLFMQLFTGLAMVIAILDDQRDAAVVAASQVEHIAYNDPLTGLPNRALFFDRLIVALSHAQRHQHKLAVLFLDMDRFKQINDSLGHSTGDALLKIAAERLRKCVREEDTVARFGGDEFVVLIQIIARAEDAGRIARKILDAMGAPFTLGERELVISTSVGITLFPPDGQDAETLVKNADTAMYRAKHLGGDNYQFYTAAMNSRALEMLELESGLRRAVKNNELVLYYQPLIDLHSGGIAGNEALIRWNHPEKGLLLPDKFIQMAEVSGLIIPIGNWVLREACRQAKFWQRQKGVDLFVSVNLSARQFYQSDLTEQVRSALEDVEQTVRILKELKVLGVRIAIDDFGTGYSSLAYLKEFPVDTLKLDQSFLRDLIAPQDAKLVSGVIALAHSMNLQVLAEGVETLGQLDFLRNNECDRLQGFLFSRPLQPEAFDKFWTHHKTFSKIA